MQKKCRKCRRPRNPEKSPKSLGNSLGSLRRGSGKSRKSLFGLFPRLFGDFPWGSRTGGPGRHFRDFFGISGPKGPRDLCKGRAGSQDIPKKQGVYTNFFEKFAGILAFCPVARVRNPTEIVQKKTCSDELFNFGWILSGGFPSSERSCCDFRSKSANPKFGCRSCKEHCQNIAEKKTRERRSSPKIFYPKFYWRKGS